MARKLTGWLGVGLFAATAVFDSAGQTPAEPSTPVAPPPFKRRPHDGGGEMHRPGAGSPDGEKLNTVRKAIEALTPEQRKRFQENFLRWSNLGTEEKKALADRDSFRRKKMSEDIDAALKDAGLELDSARRELFAKRYSEERHKIEEQLRKEMEDRRRPLLQEVMAKLKAEFSAPASQTGAPAPGPADSAPKPIPAQP